MRPRKNDSPWRDLTLPVLLCPHRKLPYEGNAAHGSNSTKAPPLSLPRSHGPPAVPGSSTAALAAGVADPRPLQGTIPRNIGDLERLQIL